MKARKNNRILAALFSMAAFSQSLTFSHAGQIWDGGGADNNWNTAANWDADTLPDFANAITFAGSTLLTASNNVTAATVVGGINFTNTATNAFTLSGNSITLGGNITTTAATAALTDTMSLAIILNASRTITTNTNHNLTISGVISGANFGIVKNGAGTLILSVANTFSGSLDIAAGRLRVGSATAVGANGTIISNSTSTNTVFAASGASALTLSRTVSLNTGGGAITFGDTTGTGDLTFTGSLTRAGGATNRTINVAGSTTVTFNGDLLSPGTPTASTTFTKGGTGTLAIRGTGSTTDLSFSQIVVTGGTFSVTRLANMGAASSLGRATAATPGAASITLDGAALRYIDGGAAASSSDRLLQIGRTTAAVTGTIRNDATSPAETVTFSNTGSIAYGNANQTRTLVLRGTNTGTNTFASMIGDNGSAAVSLTKQDAGTWLLSGTNTFTGATTISGGTLALIGAGSVNNTSGITVNGTGAKLLQNSSEAATPIVTLTLGTLTGAGTLDSVTVGAGTGGIISNNNGVAGAALTIGALNFNGAASVNTFHTAGEFATSIVTSALSTNATGVVTLNPSAGFWTNGSYSLMSYTGSVGGAGAGQIVLGTVSGLSARQSPSFVHSGSSFNLTISGDTPKWTGLDGGNWQTGTTGVNENWVLQIGATPVSYLSNDDVLFDDTATGATSIDVNIANVTPFATTFNNSTKNYTLGSAGGFGIASGPLTKFGTGTLTILNRNTYLGATVVNGGVLDVSTDGAQLYNGAASINSSVTVTNGGVLVVRQFGQANTSGTGSPSLGNLLNTGGQVIIDGGTLRFNNEISSRGRVINVGPNGATFDVVNSTNYTWTTSPGTAVPFTGSGQTLTLTGDSSSSGGINLVIGGTGVSVVKNGESTWSLAGANTYTGGTTINASSGILSANMTATANGLGTGAVSVGTGSTMRLNVTATTGTIPVNNVFTGTGLIQVQFAANATARSTQIPNLTGFTGSLRLSSLGATGDKWNITGNGTIPAPLLIDSGNTLFASAGTTTFSGGISVSSPGNSEARGAIRVGTATIAGNITLTGDTTFSMESTASGLLSGNITSGVAAPLTLTLGGTGSIGGTLGGVIGGGLDVMSLTTALGGTYSLTNANTYTGATTIASGTTLRLGNGADGFDGSINATSGVTNDGTLNFSPFGASSSSYPISGNGSIAKSGPGTHTVSGIHTYTGSTTVNAGTLTLDYSTNNDSKLDDISVLNLAGGTINLSGGSHQEVVGFTTLVAGTASTVSRTSGTAILRMGSITPNAGATINFAQSGIATTDTPNNSEGFIGAWATVNGTDLAVNSTNDLNGLITGPTYADVTRLSSGTKVIANNANGFVRIIEGTGTPANITLAAAVTSMATLTQSVVGGSGAAIIDPAGQTLATSTIFSVPGAGALTIGSGTNNGNIRALLAGGDLAVNNLSSSVVTINSVISDNSSSTLTKIGTGALLLNGNNTFNGETFFNGGTLVLGNAGALGLSGLTIQSGNLDSSVADLVLANSNPIFWNGNFTFDGSQNLDLGTGPVTTNAARTVTVAANALTISGAISPSTNVGSHITKLGNGTLVLNGATALGNNGIIVNRGTVRFGGILTTNTGAGAAGSTFRIGNLTNASAAWVQNGGSVTISVTDVDGMNLGNADNAPSAFGSMTIAGGTFTAPRVNIGGSGAVGGTNGVGIMNVLSGGSATLNNYFIGGRSATNTGSVTIAGGSLNLASTSFIATSIGAWGGGRLEVNIGANLGGFNNGGSVTTGVNSYSAVASNAAGQGIVNVLGGTLTTNAISSPAGTSTGTGINQINFNGGTLKYSGTAANATFLAAIPAGTAGASGVFVRSGGMVLDNSGQNVTIAAALLAPTGGEITSISVTGADAPGTFFTAPYVRITGGNNDATAIATIKDDGSLDSIIVTNPGSGYTANPPTVTLVGGTNAGGASTATGTATAVVGDSVSGGFTKRSANYITFSGNNTYAGVTTIEAGSITLNGVIPNPNTSYDVKSGAQAYCGWAVPGVTFPNNFTIAGFGFSEGGINVSAIRASNNQVFTGTITLAANSRIGMIETTAACTYSGKFTGDFSLDIQGAHNGNSGTQTFTLANAGTPSDYAGNTSLSTVGYGSARTGASTILRLGADEQIPHGVDKGNLALNGPNANNLTILELNGRNETINGLSNANAAGAIIRNTGTVDSILTVGDYDTSGSFSGAISDSGTGRTLSLTKIGSGTLTLSGANTYIGATLVTVGTLELVGGSLASPVTVSAGASLGFTIGSPTTSTSTFSLSAGTIKITGTPTLNSHDLITTSAGITGTPVLDAPIAGYELKVVGNSLKLVKAGYASWAGANGAGANLNDDHDNDGVANGVEYFLGGPSGTTTGFTALPGVTNTAGTLSVTWVMGAGYAGVYNTDFTVETSDTLTGTWTTESSPGTVTISGSNVTYTFPAPLGTKRFARLKVTGP